MTVFRMSDSSAYDPPEAWGRAPLPPPPPEAIPPSWIAAIDLGMMSDPTALALIEKTVTIVDRKQRNHYAVRHLQRWLGVDYPSICEELRPMLATLTPPPTLVGDETGVGLGVLQVFRKARLPVANVRGIIITAGHAATTRPQGSFTVPKKELVAHTQSALQGGRLAIAPSLKEAKILRQELANFKLKINIATGSESFEAWRQGQTDDLVLAVCMGVWFGDQGDRRLTADQFYL